MAPTTENTNEKAKSPGKDKTKLKRLARKSFKRKKVDSADSDWEDTSEIDFDAVIEKKVNVAIDNILEKITNRLDDKLELMVKSYDKKIEDCVSKIVQDKTQQIKVKIEKNSSEIAVQAAKLNTIKTQSTKNKADILNQNKKIAKIDQNMEKNKTDIAKQAAKMNHVEMQGDKNAADIATCEDKIRGIENSLEFYSADIDDMKQKLTDVTSQFKNGALTISEDNQTHAPLDVLLKG